MKIASIVLLLLCSPASASSGGQAPSTVFELNELGRAASVRGDSAGAEKFYRQAIQVDANYAWPHMNLASILESREQFDDAEREFREGVGVAPGDDAPFSLLAQFLIRHDRTAEARELLDRALSEGYDTGGVHAGLAMLASLESNWPEAERQFKIALLRPLTGTSPPAAYRAEWRKLLAIVLMGLKRHAEAEQQYWAVLAEFPDDAMSLNEVAWPMVERGERLAEAVEMLLRAVKADPYDGSIRDSLGWAYYKLERFDEAERHLAAAVALEKNIPELKEHFGDLYVKRGQLENASAMFEQALAASADDAALKARLEERLNRLKAADVRALAMGFSELTLVNGVLAIDSIDGCHSALARAGVRQGDLFIAIAGEPPGGELSEVMRRLGGKLGTSVVLSVRSFGNQSPREITLVRGDAMGSCGTSPRYGLSLMRYQGQLYVTEVTRGGPATLAGINAGEEIDEINREPAQGLTIAEALRALEGPADQLTSAAELIVYAPAQKKYRDVRLQAGPGSIR